MPAELNMLEGGRVLFARFHGDVDNDDLLAQTKAIREHPGITSETGLIVDMTEIASFRVTPDGARSVMADPGPFHRSQKPIVVIATSDVVYGTARLLEMASFGLFNVRVVRSREEAFAVFGVGDPLATKEGR